MIKIIFTDVDGTLFNDNHTITDYTKKMCIEVQKKDIPVIINTGRIISNAIEIAKMINAHRFNSYAIGNNGAEIYSFKEKKLIFQAQIGLELTKKIYFWAENKKLKCQLYSSIGTYVNKFGENSSYWADVMQAQYQVIENKKDIPDNIVRVIIISAIEMNNEQSDQLMIEFETKFTTLEIKKYHNRVFEITMPKISKGFAVQYICDLLGYDAKDAMAFGDSYNDIWLLQAVGHPVAVENAVNIVKEQSTYICASNNENGVAKTIAQRVIDVKI